MLDLIAYFLVRGLNLVFSALPMEVALWFGRRVGTLIHLFSGRRSKIAYSNLKAAFGEERTPAELKRLTGDVYIHMGQTFAELIAMTKVDAKYVDKYIKIHNIERVDRASKNPNGMILVSAHFGNWELVCVSAVYKGYPMYMIARDQKMKRLNELLNVLREMKGNFVIRKGMDIKNVFRVLHAGKCVGLLGDQNAGANGQLANLFGRPASVAVGPYRFAQKCGAWVLPAFVHRVKGPYHEVVLEEPLEIKEGEDLLPYIQRYNDLLEKNIRNHPEQWFWMHKRWKATPLKSVLVLDDAKMGHLKQSLAAVKQIRKYRQDKGFAAEHTKVDIVRIKFKNDLRKAVFNSLSPAFSSRCQGSLKFLRWALDDESYRSAVMRYADVVVSCGSALAGVNITLKRENYCRNLTILDPGRSNRGKFDVVVMPAHDAKGKKQADNVAVTDLAPNLIDPDEIASFPPSIAKPHRGTCIGLLAGGDNDEFAFSKELARSLAVAVRSAADRLAGVIYATTSRRTPEEADTVLKDALRSDPRCAGFVVGKEDKDEHTVEKILSSCDVVLVSGESISMVSEAVSSGKPVLVFMPDKKVEKYTKYEKFVDGLAARGFIERVKVSEIAEKAAHVAENKVKFALPEDNKRMYDKMYRLF